MKTIARTMFEMAGVHRVVPPLNRAILVLVDFQNEYLAGDLALSGVNEAVERAVVLLKAARAAGGRIIHVAHQGRPGGAFDRDAERGQIIAQMRPLVSEPVVEKTKPNAFFGTNLAELISEDGAELIVAGFMTHHCVSSTTRSAVERGYQVTVVADACATRSLPLGNSIVDASVLQSSELAALADRHALVVDVARLVSMSNA